jgi:hypothetical protein
MTRTPFSEAIAGLYEWRNGVLEFFPIPQMGLYDVAGSNPASPSLGFLGRLLRSEEVPAEWWGSWVSQRATESLSNERESFPNKLASRYL